MARQVAPRALSLTEELEKLEQSITLTLQEIDSNFSKAHRIVTSSILPIVEQYAKHSNEVWEGSKFWKQFFEASANVSLSGYEEAALDEEASHTETTSTDLQSPTDHEEYATHEPTHQQTGDDESFSVDSPTQVTGNQSTPKLPPSTAKKSNRTATYSKTTSVPRSPSPRKYTGKNPLALTDSPVEEPSTPRSHADILQSSPFEPESAYQPSAARLRTTNDPIMHRAVLDKNYRIQATPHTQQRQHPATTSNRTPATATKRTLWDDSPQSSPIEAPQLRSDLFSPAKGPAGAPRTPGVSVLTPARKSGRAVPVTSTGRQLFSPEDKTYSEARARSSNNFNLNEDYEDDTDTLGMSPPKTLQFHVPQSRLMQTPAREASKRIVEDLLLTAGADNTDDIDDLDYDDIEEGSPSVVRMAYDVNDDTF